MKSIEERKHFRQLLIDSAYFWGFWTLVLGVSVWAVEGTLTSALKGIVGVLLPQVIPVLIIGMFFDSFFMRRKVLLFFIAVLPFGYLSGLLMNTWSHRILGDLNIQANHELLVFIFAPMYIGFRYIKVALAQKIALAEIENKQAIAELNYLRSQLNPHFLFNSLNSIYSLVLSKSDKAEEAILTLSELMRYHIDLSGRHVVGLPEELSLLERYISLESLKLQDRCTIRFQVEGNPEGVRIAPLIFMPFVENAFKHGIGANPSSNFVFITVRIKSGKLEMCVSNSCPPPQKKATSNGVKVGISNTLKRLNLYYGKNYTFSRVEEPGRHEVKITIDLRADAA